jgi:hypothetical protein
MNHGLVERDVVEKYVLRVGCNEPVDMHSLGLQPVPNSSDELIVFLGRP